MLMVLDCPPVFIILIVGILSLVIAGIPQARTGGYDKPRDYRYASEKNLIQWAQEADRKAFDALIEKHEKNICRIANKIFNDKDSEEDAVAITKYKAWKSISSFEQKAQFSTWIYRICINECSNIIAYNKKRKCEETGIYLSEKDTSYLDEGFYAVENRSLIFGLMGQVLSNRDAEIMKMHCERYSATDIAQQLGLSEANVRKILSRAHRRLEQASREITGENL